VNERRERGGGSIRGTAGSSVIEPAVLAAIVAAVEATWPRVAPAEPVVEVADPARWRFSRRWWSTPPAARRPPAAFLVGRSPTSGAAGAGRADDPVAGRGATTTAHGAEGERGRHGGSEHEAGDPARRHGRRT
jgi:hypothetical protein